VRTRETLPSSQRIPCAVLDHRRLSGSSHLDRSQ
jgi:hypothetical protein